jgi:hypothetical protein
MPHLWLSVLIRSHIDTSPAPCGTRAVLAGAGVRPCLSGRARTVAGRHVPPCLNPRRSSRSIPWRRGPRRHTISCHVASPRSELTPRSVSACDIGEAMRCRRADLSRTHSDLVNTSSRPRRLLVPRDVGFCLVDELDLYPARPARLNTHRTQLPAPIVEHTGTPAGPAGGAECRGR